MPIEFPCTECRQQVRTPDAAAGKKGRCPHCGAVMMIPGGKQPAPSSPAPPPEKPKLKPTPKLPAAASLSPPPPGGSKWRGDPSAAPEKLDKPAPQPAPATPKKASSAPAAAGPIEFPCPQCRGLVRTPPSAAGKKGKCPHCQAIVQIPAAAPAATPAKKPASAPPATPSTKATPTKSAHAPGDSAALAAPRAHTISPKLAPPDSVDPNIGASYPLGSGLEPAEKKPQLHTPALAALDDLVPLPSTASSSGLTPLSDDSGLTPLPDSAGLVPLPTASGLTPLPSLGGLTPLGTEASGLTPLGTSVDFSAAYSLPAADAPTIISPPAGRTAADIRMMVLIPAIFQMLSTLPTIIYILIQGAVVTLRLVTAVQLSFEDPEKFLLLAGTVGSLFGLLIWLLAVLFIMKGSLDLMNRQSYFSALIASMLSILLCTCGIGFPFGLWSLIVLCFADVRQSFNR